MMSEGLKIVTSDDVEQAKRPAVRQTEPEEWSDAEPSQLVELLDDIDGLKYEIHERMRRIEAVKQAKSVLLEDAIKTEALNKKLAALGKAMAQAPTGLSIAEPPAEEAKLLRIQPREVPAEPRYPETRFQFEEAERLRIQPRETPREAEPRYVPIVPLVETEETVWPRSKPTREASEEAESRYSVGRAKQEDASLVRMYTPEITVEPQTYNPETRVPQETIEALRAQAAAVLATPEPSYSEVKAPGEPAAQEWRRDEEDSAAHESQAPSPQLANFARGYHDPILITSEAGAALNSATESMQRAEEAWKKADEATLEAKRLLEQSVHQVNLAHSKEEKASADLRSAQQEMTTAYQFAAVAAQRQHDAAQFFRRATRWTVIAVGISWIAMVWMAWLALPIKMPRLNLPIWAPGVASGVIALAAVLITAWATREDPS